MSLIARKIAALQRANREVLDALSAGQMTTGDLIQRLGYSIVNFGLTRMIGDNLGEWDNSPHQLALTDLVEIGRVKYRRDASNNVWYERTDKRVCDTADL